MEPAEVVRAVDAAISIAGRLGLVAERATILQNSNKLALRLLPCDAFARVAPVEHEHARFEIELARQLAATGSPVAALDPRVEPRGYEHDGFEVTFWTYYDARSEDIPPTAYAEALGRLHAGMNGLDVATPHVTDRVAHALELATNPQLTPELVEEDRELLVHTLQQLRRGISERAAGEQLIHGEPHPGNVLSTLGGLRFIDLETCCRGPVEFDVAHAPAAVAGHYLGLDEELLDDCRRLVLAMVATWRWERGDQLPDGRAFGRELLDVLRSGPPWPTVDEVHGRLDLP